MSTVRQVSHPLPVARVDVVERGVRARTNRVPCIIDRDVTFSTALLESYCLTAWEPVVFDALLVAAAVEFCDKTHRRPTQSWSRRIELQVPVHEPDRWNEKAVHEGLQDALAFLTGDQWSFHFVGRKAPASIPGQIHFSLPQEGCAIIPYSDGLDSRAVAGLAARELGERLIRVRLGSKTWDTPLEMTAREKQPFTSIPYRVPLEKGQAVESSARSRGFKFALMSALAAYLIKAHTVIVPESGQGALGPALVTVGQSYEDYRNHPLFTDRMERLALALFGHRVRFEFPQLWHTKGQTLARFVTECGDSSWNQTRSCWQQNRQVSVGGRKRQCGVCAACMLRRLSVHAAGLQEPNHLYVWEDLTVPTFEGGAAAGFGKITPALREYAIAGTLHLDHLASLQRSAVNQSALDMAVFQLSRSRGLPESEVRAKLARLLEQHEREWRNFLGSLGSRSFVANWTVQS